MAETDFHEVLRRLRANCPSATTVRLRGIGPDGARLLSGALLENTIATSLRLSHNGIGDGGATALAESLLGGSSIVAAVNLNWNGIGDDGAIALARAISSPRSKIRSLNLEGNDIGPAGAEALAKALRRDGSLVVSLNLKDNRIGAKGAAALAETLSKRHCSLSMLDLVKNGISDEGAMALADAVRDNSSVALDLGRNNIGQLGTEAIFKAVRQNPSRVRPRLDLIRQVQKYRSHYWEQGAFYWEMFREDDVFGLINKLTGINIWGNEPSWEPLNLLADVYTAGLIRLARQCRSSQEHTTPNVLEKVGGVLGLTGIYEVMRCQPDILLNTRALSDDRVSSAEDTKGYIPSLGVIPDSFCFPADSTWFTAGVLHELTTELTRKGEEDGELSSSADSDSMDITLVVERRCSVSG